MDKSAVVHCLNTLVWCIKNMYLKFEIIRSFAIFGTLLKKNFKLRKITLTPKLKMKVGFS